MTRVMELVAALSFVFFATAVMKYVGLAELAPKWSISKSEQNPTEITGTALQLDRLVDSSGRRAKVPRGVTKAAVFASCTACSDIGPWSLKQYKGQEPLAVIIGGKPAGVDIHQWNLPRGAYVFFDPSLDAMGDRMYASAPLGVQWDAASREVVSSAPLHVMFEGALQ